MRIAVAVAEFQRNYSREMLRGVSAYRQEAGWDVAVWERDAAMPDGCAGVVGYLRADARATRRVLRAGLPAVTTSAAFKNPDLPEVVPDDLAVGRLAVEHLLSRGLTRVAYFGDRRLRFSRNREAGLQRRMREAGLRAASLPPDPEAAAERLAEAARPVAVVALSDSAAVELLTACLARGLRVPEDVAVLGVDDDELLCETAPVPISSVRPDWQRIGYEAAATLHRMLDGEPPAARSMTVPPLGVVVRRSTDVYAMEDAEMAEALRFIHEQARHGIGVEDVAAHVAMSRSAFERRFKRVVGQTPYRAIAESRVRQAQKLLAQTEQSMEQIAAACGYSSGAMLSIAFRAQTSQTPTQYRKRHRTGG